jgi:hypothetical protein
LRGSWVITFGCIGAKPHDFRIRWRKSKLS